VIQEDLLTFEPERTDETDGRTLPKLVTGELQSSDPGTDRDFVAPSPDLR
jgi:hypothetical protein